MRIRNNTTWLLFFSFFILYYLLPPMFRDLWQPDETRYAEISREMLASGNWITPHFFGLRYFEKPVAGYWINSLGQWLFGHNNFGVRAGSIVSTTVTALLIYWLGRRLFGSARTAVVGSVIFLSSLLVYGVGTYAVLDPMLMLWLAAAMCSFWLATEASGRARRAGGYLLLGLACGMGFMTKGFLALVVPVLAILPWTIWRQRLRELFCYGPLALLSAAAISAPWALAIHHQAPDFWHYFFWVEHIQRFAEENAQHKAPFWYYLPILLLGTLPWLALLPGALMIGWRQRQQHPGALYLLSWTVMPLLFFSLAKGKLPTYILPCFVPLSLLMAHYGLNTAQRAGRALTVNGWINLIFGILTVATVLLVLAPWSLTHHPLFAPQEKLKLGLAALAFLVWGAVGAYSCRSSRHRWLASALCPLGVALLIGSAIPAKIRDAKQPQSFVSAMSDRLAASRFILADNPGVASAAAWHLHRSDIGFYDARGELEYGLSYPDAQSRFVSAADFSHWLDEHRRLGSVSLLLLVDSVHSDIGEEVPVPDAVYRQGRLVGLYYSQMK
ncbi:lipid IV(A) 4-amino-4-deoxy-L-arabinosyltransferase [Pantoea sp. Ep11b]|uniref:lipid IV(A) 4-amino-4-deoxy-L-arabinosyltransferase n=1 Tax=unclassified Pantoea TaxID=2630326 RepID=UPI003460F07B